MPDFALILPAAGSSSRFGTGRNKLFEPLAGTPVILRSLNAFTQRRDVAMIVIPTPMQPELWSQTPPGIRQVVSRHARLCQGGPSRAHSVRNALSLIPASIEWVAVHDAARPLISQDLIDRTLAVAVAHGAAVPAMPVALTIKEADGPLPARVRRTVPRQSLWAMQTPQIARRDSLERAFATCPIPLDQVTDDVQLIELAGEEVWLVPGEERNLKITTAMDLRIAEMMLDGAV